MQIRDTDKLYRIIWDSIDNIGEYSRAEVIGVLEIIKAEIIEDYFATLDEIDEDQIPE